MTPKAVAVILTLLALLCLATWLFAGDAARFSFPRPPLLIPTPTPTPIPIETQTSEEAERVEAKIDTIIRLTEDLRVYFREVQERRASRGRAPQKPPVIVNKIIAPTPAPPRTIYIEPEPTPLPQGLLNHLFQKHKEK